MGNNLHMIAYVTRRVLSAERTLVTSASAAMEIRRPAYGPVASFEVIGIGDIGREVLLQNSER